VRFLFCRMSRPDGAPIIAKSTAPEEIIKARALLAHAAQQQAMRPVMGSPDKNRRQEQGPTG